jgi:hypothetical protein
MRNANDYHESTIQELGDALQDALSIFLSMRTTSHAKPPNISQDVTFDLGLSALESEHPKLVLGSIVTAVLAI